MIKRLDDLYEWTAGVVDRRIGWARLPWPLALLTLNGIRMTLRKSNLFDPAGEQFPSGEREPMTQNRSLVRSIDGSGTSLRHERAGSAGTIFGRNVPPPTLTPGGVLEPNPRLVSLRLLQRETFHPAPSLNVLVAAWLQFQIHDWLLHEPPGGVPWKVSLPAWDAWPDDPMLVYRTPPAHLEPDVPNVFANTETHWWDGSQLYGSSPKIASRLRSNEGGRMLVTDNGLVPFDPDTGRDLAGVTGNWWVGLAMMHTLFLQEHNVICEMLAAEFPSWADQELFDHARLINAALMAKIQTLDWSTAVVANKTMRIALLANWWGLVGERVTKKVGRLSGDDLVSGVPGGHADLFGVPYSITEEFVAVYRMHPLLPDEYVLRDYTDDHVLRELSFPDMALGAARSVLDDVSMENLLYSFARSHPGAICLRNYPKHLSAFRKLDGSVIDLGTTEIIRDRERGVPRYNEFRRLFHMNPVGRFEGFSQDPDIVETLREIYRHPDDVDLMIGMLAEQPMPGFAFSDTAFRMFTLMATRRLKSDRFFTDDYRPEVYTHQGLSWIANNTMKSVILRHYPALSCALSGTENAFKPWPVHD